MTVAKLEQTDGPKSTSSTTKAVIGALGALLGFGLVAAAGVQQDTAALATARPDELVSVLDELQTEQERLEDQKRQLEQDLAELESGSSDAAAAQAQQRADSLEILAGTVAAQGQGIRMTITDPAGKLEGADLVDAITELRDAGAEAIQIGSQRVVVNTWFGDGPDGSLLVSGVKVPAPYTVIAIGDAKTMATAMQIPGGVSDSVSTAGGTVDVSQEELVRVTATVPLSTPEYAAPAE